MFKGLWPSRPRRATDDPTGGALGSLERQVMDVMWEGGDLFVRDVQTRLQRAVAYTTVMTTLDRLYKKGFVSRARQGRAYSYTATSSRDEIRAGVAAGALSGMLAGGGTAALPVLSNLVEAVAEEEGGEELLDRLEALVRERRRALQERRK